MGYRTRLYHVGISKIYNSYLYMRGRRDILSRKAALKVARKRKKIFF